ncbi:Holliday junction branch migration protein RuvA [Lottiidibacillus patelloidae]|uniref:Holliday junction branch migration complex subunit RuvA n=1 Tax=Lottiidibacillus patelloidae TaxID=2670334 RepID=A0A263BVU2_9BACI|nr:Holliday junction branch migration protein RuvA [Lottiidibacillus patelloidae]OZM57839.1 Holliday junction branch migration protein RuvA [Lottiidibacillus patelloidae]
MYEYIKGTMNNIASTYVVIETNNIGYQILTANPFVFQDQIGEEVTVYTYQYVREDLIALYGFPTHDERSLFMKLIQVSGIGPKGALAILAAGQPKQLANAIENEDDKFLTKFPGVGKKTARQMILDLKGKLEDQLPNLFQPEVQVESTQDKNIPLEEAIEALKALGYAEREIKKVMPILLEQECSADEYVKKALRALLQ